MKPATTGAVLVLLPFEARLKLVAEEIQRRKLETNPENPGAFVARLWVQWLKKNVLDVSTGQEVAV